MIIYLKSNGYLIFYTVSYDDVQRGQSTTVLATCHVTLEGADALLANPCAKLVAVDEQDNRLLALDAMAEARRLAQANDLEGARANLARMVARMEASAVCMRSSRV